MPRVSAASGWGDAAGPRTPTRPACGRSTSPLQGEVYVKLPITFHLVTAG